MKVLAVACMAAALLAPQGAARQTVLQPAVAINREVEAKKVEITAENRLPFDQVVLTLDDLLNNNSPKDYIKQYIDEQRKKLPSGLISKAISELSDLNTKKSQLTAEALRDNVQFLKAHSATLNDDQLKKLEQIEGLMGYSSNDQTAKNQDFGRGYSPPSHHASGHKKFKKKKQKKQHFGDSAQPFESASKQKLHKVDVEEARGFSKAKQLEGILQSKVSAVDKATKATDKATKKDDQAAKKKDPFTKMDDETTKMDDEAGASLKDALKFHKQAEGQDEVATKGDLAAGEKVAKEKNGKEPVDAGETNEAATKVKQAAKDEDDEANEKDKTAVKKVSDAISKEKDAKQDEDDATASEKTKDVGTAILKKKKALTSKKIAIDAKLEATKKVSDAAEKKVSATKKKKVSKTLEKDADKDDEETSGKKVEQDEDAEKAKDVEDDQTEDSENQSGSGKKKQQKKAESF